MGAKKTKLSELKITDKFMLSFPLRREISQDCLKKYQGLPFIIINQKKEIVSGIDFFYFLKKRGYLEAEVLKLDIKDKDALFLNFNLKEKFFGVNLYEKLIFIKKISSQTTVKEIYQKTNLNIKIDKILIEKIDSLVTDEFKELLINERIDIKTALKIVDFSNQDKKTLIKFFAQIRFTVSEQLKILEMIEEIRFRDKLPLENIFKRMDLNKYFENKKPQKQIMESIFSYRYPLYSQKEKSWLKEIKKLKYPANIKISHYPFFEKKQIEMTILLDGIPEAKKLISELNKLL